MNDKLEQEPQEFEQQEETSETDVEKSDIDVKDAIEEEVRVEEEQVAVLVEQTEHEEKIELADDEAAVGDETVKKEVLEESRSWFKIIWILLYLM